MSKGGKEGDVGSLATWRVHGQGGLGRERGEGQMVPSNTVPVATAKVPLNKKRNKSPREISGERNSAGQDQVNRPVNQDMV